MTFSQFKDQVEAVLGDYSKTASFLVGNTAYDRLEAIPGKTTRVFVPLKDFRETDCAAYQIVANFPRGGGQVTSSDQWIVIPTGVDFQPNDVVKLELMKDGQVVDTSALTFVAERPCSIAYPKWVGEAFDFGEWTMDYATAKTKGGYVLAMFTGTMWCPYCRGCETSLLADPRFTQWAKDNSVALVSFDQGNSSDPATAAGNGKCRLLAYEAGESHIVTGEKPSGAFYLSTKGIDANAAQERIDLTTKYTQEWLAPGSTSARLGNPTFLLLKNDKVVGRLASWRDDDRAYDVVENLARLDDLLKLASRADESSEYAESTRLTHGIGMTSEMDLQINERYRAFVLTGLETGTLTLSAANDKGGAVGIEYIVDGTVVASEADKLVVKVKKSDLGKRVVVRVCAYPNTKVMFGGTSLCKVGLTSSLEPSPVVDEATLPKGFAADICLEEIEADGEVRSVSVRRTGKLPSGLTLKYDKESQSIILSGKPSKAAQECVFTYTYTITYKDRRKVTSEPVEVTVRTFDPSTLNPYLGVTQNRTIPIISADKLLIGTLTVTTTTRGAVTAKYVGESKVTFRGNWTELVDDAAVVDLSTKKGEKLRLALDSNGLMTAVLKEVDGFGRIDGLSSALTTVGFEAFKGVYTVVLRDESGLGGHGYLTLKMTSSSQVKKGTMSYSGLLPNGTSVSGSAQLSGAGFDEVEGLGLCECAELPIFRKTAKLNVRLVLRMRANGEATHLDEENSWAHVVHASDAAIPLVNGAVVSPYGVWFETNRKLSEWQGLYPRIGDTFALRLGGTTVAKAKAVGSKVTLSEKLGTVSLSYVKTKGVISGRMKFALDGATLNGTWKGVILPGWHYDCGCGGDDPPLPFGSGTFYYTDKSSGKAVKRSLPVELTIGVSF